MLTFDALSKELYSLKQGMGENVAEFGMHLSQQVQILQMENSTGACGGGEAGSLLQRP